jgi:hypothetical protein
MMQYLKPEILARCRSLDDDVSEAADDEWEQAVARYNADLDAIRPTLPAGARALLASCSLHDARILSIIEARRRPRLSLLIQLEGRPTRPGPLMELQYILARTSRHPGFSLVVSGQPEKDLQDKGRIQYDEFGKVADDLVAVFSHSLLLKGGVEVQIRFIDLRVRALERVILPSVEPMGLAMA